MDISIIIPVYNGEETLELCLDAVTALKIPEGMNIEILLVNDGSTDRTKEIASSYKQVRIIDLEKNSGRIIARKTGAENAKYEDLLFIDARVEVRYDALEKISEIGYSPLMVGSLNDDKYKSDYDTLLYLIRRKFYYPYYPQEDYGKELWISQENFQRAPKGTGYLFLNRELFLKSLPDKLEKDTSDDTAILKNIVFENSTKILRHTELRAKYHSRQDNDIAKWINHRGKTFADHYLTFVNRYSALYFTFLAVLIGLFIFRPLSLIFFLAFSVGLSALYLCENKKDVMPVIKQVPYLGGLFFLGTLEKLFKMIFKK
ncbi:MAG: glycosyltransferase family 2 protein [Candidatus Delongbacteria bacterium]|nr:glycosyltransferase family 2 protein [Candidatus Delongbacteria bacterium]